MATRSTLDRQALLRRVFLFQELGDRELDLLAECTVSRRLSAREELFHKGDASDECYAIVTGALKASSTSPEGKEMTFSVMGPGEVFGEVAMLCGGRRTATVQALDASELLVIRRRDLLPLFEREPRIAIASMAALAERLANVSELAEDHRFRNLPARLARKLVALSESYGSPEGDSVVIELKLSQTELGNMVGATREAVNKQIRAWEKDGVVQHEAGRLQLLDLAQLEALSELAPI